MLAGTGLKESVVAGIEACIEEGFECSLGMGWNKLETASYLIVVEEDNVVAN